jgi:hypothetical protein
MINTMKKITLIMSLMVMATFTFAQVTGVYAPTKDKANKNAVVKTRAVQEDAVWQVTFDEDSVTWTVGHDVGDSDWVVADTCITGTDYEAGEGESVPVGTMVSSMWLYMGHQDLGEYSESGGNFAWFDVITDVVAGVYVAHNAWVLFDSIDLTLVANPKITFYQNYKALNAGMPYVDFSIDDGATWIETEVNPEVAGNSYGTEIYELIAPTGVGGQANVSMRFRYYTDDTDVNGYGWMIDDIKIIDNPDVDMMLKSGEMNFFEYTDYTDPTNADYFHSSSHYGMIPEEQFNAEGAAMLFNAIVENRGNLEATVDVNVKVYDTEMAEIYNETVTSISLARTDVDTVDVLTELTLATPAVIGEYTVIYSLIADGDAAPEDNADTTYFYVTDATFSRDLDIDNEGLTGSLSLGGYLSGHVDGEMISTNYLFLYETTIESMDVYISASSDAGTSMVAHIMQYDDDAADWVDLAGSALVILTEDDLGTWLNFTFPDAINIVPDDDGSFSVKAAVEFFYNGDDNDLYVGYDPSVISSMWGTFFMFQSGDNIGEWYSYQWNEGGIGIRVNTPASTAISTINVDNVNVYPNPTTGLVTIQNVEGADVAVYNMLGMCVYSEIEVEGNISVDMSNMAEGTYIVRISGVNAVKTQKINLIK